MVHTITGGLTTFLVLVVMLVYASIKVIHLLSKHNPNVVMVHEKNFFDYKDKLDLNQIDFRLAFSVENYHTREFKNDPRYVKYLVRIYGVENGEEYEHIIKYHKCEQKDWDLFPEPAESAKD